jgi:5-methylcytosine-specific restriction endonuclease McrA
MPLVLIPTDWFEKLSSGEASFAEYLAFLGSLPEEDSEEETSLITKDRYSKVPIPSELRWQVWERDNFTCKLCGSRTYLHADHVIPESKGGETTLENLQTLCRRCNSKKGNKT